MVRQRGFSLVEILIVLAIIGVLVGLLLPCVRSIKAASAKLECANNLKAQGIALHSYHGIYGVLPPAKINSGTIFRDRTLGPAPDFYGTSTRETLNHSGFTMLLPFLDYDDLHRQYDYTMPSCNAVSMMGCNLAQDGVPPDHPNIAVVSSYIQAYHCPADVMPDVDTNAPGSMGCTSARRTNYLMCIYDLNLERLSETEPEDMFIVMGWLVLPTKRGMFSNNSKTRIADVSDGLSNTIAIGETKQQSIDGDFQPHWGAAHLGSMTGAMQQLNGSPGELTLNFPIGQTARYASSPSDPSHYLQPAQGFGSWHVGGANFLFGDGAVRFIRNNIRYSVYRSMGTMNNNDRVILPD